VRALLDQTFSPAETPECPEQDRNIYVFGQMGQHMVVCTTLPYYGNNAAAICAENLRRSFSNILFCFLVGIGGGIPSPLADVRLGDVVVSVGVRELSAVIQYDHGKRNDNGDFERTGCLPNPPAQLLGAIAHIRSDPLLIYQKRPLDVYLAQIRARILNVDDTVYQYPGSHLDVLMESVDLGGSYRQKQRKPRAHDGPVIHYGPIASGNSVIKSAEFRDMLALKDGVLCCDMEAAGVAVAFPSQLLVVRGICDYSDAQKNKEWQDYAAATAAAYVKLLLSVVPANTRRPAQDREEHTRKRTRTEA
jgi:nucleoside phosphorylase